MNLEDLCARLECEYLAIKEDWSVPIPRNPDGLEAAKHLRVLSTENVALRQRVAELEGVLSEARNQLWLLAKDPKTNPWVIECDKVLTEQDGEQHNALHGVADYWRIP